MSVNTLYSPYTAAANAANPATVPEIGAVMAAIPKPNIFIMPKTVPPTATKEDSTTITDIIVFLNLNIPSIIDSNSLPTGSNSSINSLIRILNLFITGTNCLVCSANTFCTSSCSFNSLL